MSTEPTVQEEKEEEALPGESLPSMLKALPGAPTQEQVEKWKVEFGEVFVSGFSETELFVWRAVTRPEWVDLQIAISNPDSGINQYQFEEMICDTCVLWKSVDRSWDKGKAGTPTTLQEQILQNSNFLAPQAASMLVAKL